jgi:selenocysteine lyase/cysteine desulfurase
MGALSGGLLLSKSKPALSSFIKNIEDIANAPRDDGFWKFVRSQFLFPENYAYLNTGGLGAMPAVVLERVKKTMFEKDFYLSAGHDLKRWNEVKEKCAGLFGPNCKKEEIALTNTATEGINVILNGLPLKKGDEVITSTHEHPALNISLLNRKQRDGIVIKTFEPDLKNGVGNLDRIERLITGRTRLVFISHFTCTTGQRFPEKEIGEIARARGIWYALDGAQTVGNMPIDVKDTGVDFYAISGHKWVLGPKRTGILYVREELLETLQPTIVGAYSDASHDISQQSLVFQSTAQRYEYGTQNEALYWGLGDAVDFIQAIGVETVWQHNRHLAEMFYKGLKKMPDVTLLSPEEERYRTSLITFKIPEINYRDVTSHMIRNSIRVRPVPEANLEAVRVSFHVYNHKDEVERILQEIRELVKS